MESKKTKTSKDIITPERKTDILLNEVQFSRLWTFWETYSSNSRQKKLDYNDSNKLIFK